MAGNQELLASVPLFAKLQPKALDRLDRISVERTFPAGSAIVTEGEAAAGFFIIRKGKVEVVRGEDTSIATLSTGEYFGDMALLDGRPRAATVRAIEDTECLVMTRWDFVAEVRGTPDIVVELLEQLSSRIRELEGRIEQLESHRG